MNVREGDYNDDSAWPRGRSFQQDSFSNWQGRKW
jgi:hypothetical protein